MARAIARVRRALATDNRSSHALEKIAGQAEDRSASDDEPAEE